MIKHIFWLSYFYLQVPTSVINVRWEWDVNFIGLYLFVDNFLVIYSMSISSLMKYNLCVQPLTWNVLSNFASWCEFREFHQNKLVDGWSRKYLKSRLYDLATWIDGSWDQFYSLVKHVIKGYLLFLSQCTLHFCYKRVLIMLKSYLKNPMNKIIHVVWALN